MNRTLPFYSVYMYFFYISHKPSWAGCSPAGEINEIKNLIDLLIDGYIVDINTTKYIQVNRTKRQFSQKGGKSVFVLFCCLPFLLLFFSLVWV